MSKYSNFIHCKLTQNDLLSDKLNNDFGITLNYDNGYDYIKSIGLAAIAIDKDELIELKIKSIVDDSNGNIQTNEDTFIISDNKQLNFQNVKILDVYLSSGQDCYVDLILTNSAYDTNILDISKPILPIFPIEPTEIDRESWVDGAIMGNVTKEVDGQLGFLTGTYERNIDTFSNIVISKEAAIIDDDIESTEEDL